MLNNTMLQTFELSINQFDDGDVICLHKDKKYTLFVKINDDRWIKSILCKQCCNECIKEHYKKNTDFNYKVFYNDHEITHQCDLTRKNVCKFPVLKFFVINKQTVTLLSIRKIDFMENPFEIFYYEKLEKWYNDLNADKIVNGINIFPNKKILFAYISIINITEFKFDEECLELPNLKL